MQLSFKSFKQDDVWSYWADVVEPAPPLHPPLRFLPLLPGLPWGIIRYALLFSPPPPLPPSPQLLSSSWVLISILPPPLPCGRRRGEYGWMEGWMWLQQLFEKRSGDFYSSSFFSLCQLKCMMGRSPVFLAASSEQETCQGQTAERAQTLRFVRSHFKKTNTAAFHFFSFTPELTAGFCQHVELLQHKHLLFRLFLFCLCCWKLKAERSFKDKR